MMKRLQISKLLMIIPALTSTSAVAHTGHMFKESVHGFLHAEHVIAIAIIGIIAFSIHILRHK